MQITGVTQHDLSHALDGSFEPNWIPGYPQGTHEVALFELSTDTEHTGYAASPSFAGGLEYDGPLGLFLTGMDPHDVDAVRRTLASVDLIGPRPWHVLVACWDLIGKDAGKPVYELLGGTGDPIPAYASAGSVGTVDDRLVWTQARVDEGFEAVKLRIASPDDVEIVEAVRESFPDVEIMVDANKGWAVRVMREEETWSPKTALAVARDLEALDVRWFEEPLPKADHAGYAELRRRTDVPIAGGEFARDLSDCYDLLDAGGVDVLQPDTALVTGPRGAVEVARAASERGVEFAPHTWTNGLGLAANLHVMAAVDAPYCEFPMEPPWTPAARDFLLEEPIQLDDDGCVAPPDGPGLGVTLDVDVLGAETPDETDSRVEGVDE
jgi:D-galactarolactone cycloisomerase